MRTLTDAGPSSVDKSPPVDLVHLSRHTLGNRSLEREVLSLFATQSVIYVDRLRAAADSKDRSEAVHTLKGSAQGIGAFQVAEAAKAVESAERDGLDLTVDEEAQDLIANLITEVATANAFICVLLGDE